MNNLISFYLKESSNCDGLWLEDIWGWTDMDLEFYHDWIQHLFPSTQESLFNPDAPLLDDATIKEWHKDGLLQDNLRKSYQRWLKFCGIEVIEGKLTLVDFKYSIWGGFNHNWLRITRVLSCLNTLGLVKEAKEFYNFLEEMRPKIDMNDETWSYWTGAMNEKRN